LPRSILQQKIPEKIVVVAKHIYPGKVHVDVNVQKYFGTFCEYQFTKVVSLSKKCLEVFPECVDFSLLRAHGFLIFWQLVSGSVFGDTQQSKPELKNSFRVCFFFFFIYQKLNSLLFMSGRSHRVVT